MNERYLRGNGVEFVRELAFAKRVQDALERLHGLERVADVDAFSEVHDDLEGREFLLVREPSDGSIELSLRLPRLGHGTDGDEGREQFDRIAQIVEGVSHFVYLTDRAAVDRATSQLELELQAEVDKYAFFADKLCSASSFCARKSAALRSRLYRTCAFSNMSASERERYATANSLADKFTERLEKRCVSTARLFDLRTHFRQFFHASFHEKVRLAA
jgi:hypothetical protein